jgi:hypothetical protein
VVRPRRSRRFRGTRPSPTARSMGKPADGLAHGELGGAAPGSGIVIQEEMLSAVLPGLLRHLPPTEFMVWSGPRRRAVSSG